VGVELGLIIVWKLSSY